MVKIALIGGSGLEDPDILKNPGSSIIETPYGRTSSDFRTGKIEGVDVIILSRHGRQHTIPPTQVNNRANIWAIHELKCTHIIATTACGSLKEDIGRGDLVFLNQFLDFTKFRKNTFFESFKPGILNHTPMADPFDKNMRELFIQKAKTLGLTFHKKGTVITIEGPRFSTRAESKMFQQWGADVINMSVATECALANEMKIPYAAIAMSTDYDSWKLDENPVTWEEVISVFNKNVKNVVDLLITSIPEIV